MAMSGNEKNLVVSFIQFLRQKVSSGQCSEEQIEGLEGRLISMFDFSFGGFVNF